MPIRVRGVAAPIIGSCAGRVISRYLDRGRAAARDRTSRGRSGVGGQRGTCPACLHIRLLFDVIILPVYYPDFEDSVYLTLFLAVTSCGTCTIVGRDEPPSGAAQPHERSAASEGVLHCSSSSCVGSSGRSTRACRWCRTSSHQGRSRRLSRSCVEACTTLSARSRIEAALKLIGVLPT
jgi:hypothetical protein